jgi:hypothetical protein
VVTAKIDEQYLGRDECETWDGFGFGMNKVGIGSRLPLPGIEPKADFKPYVNWRKGRMYRWMKLDRHRRNLVAMASRALSLRAF